MTAPAYRSDSFGAVSSGSQAPVPSYRLMVVSYGRSAWGGEEVLIDAGETFVLSRRSPAVLSAPLGVRDVDCVVLEGPYGDCLELLRQLRTQDATTPVLIITDADNGRLDLDAFVAGAQDVLVRSEMDAGLLARSVRFAVERQRNERIYLEFRESQIRGEEQARLQRGLMPAPLLSSPDLGWGAAYRAGGGRLLLGGDFYDGIELPDGRVRLLIGDVAGHGPDEAALGVALRVAWRSLVLGGADGDDALRGMDALLRVERRPDRVVFATVCEVTIAADRRTAELRLAGHPPPVLVNDGPELLAADTVGMPLGAAPTFGPVPTTLVELPASDWALLLYTDGLIEARDPDGAMLNASGLTDIVGDVSLDPADLNRSLSNIVSLVEAYSGNKVRDDMALLAVARSSDGQGRGPARG